jgi:hypothetical protein
MRKGDSAMAKKARQKRRQSKNVRIDAGTGPEDQGHPRPRVYTAEDLDLKEKKRKGAKRGSSKTARRVEDIEFRVSKAIHRLANATEKGVSRYQDARDKSARRRRDGALVDIYENAAKGVSRAISKATPATVDVAKALNSKRARKQTRSVVKSLPRIPIVG